MTNPLAGADRDGRIAVAAFRDGAVREWVDGAAVGVLEGGLVRSAGVGVRRSVAEGAAALAAAGPGPGPGAGPAVSGVAGGPAETVWIDLTQPSPAQVERVAALLGLHPLIAEDIVEGNQRSKIEATDGLVHVVLFALEFRDEIVAHEVDIVLGDGFMLSSHPAAWDPRAGGHFRAGLAPVLRSGPDHVLWALCDMIVDAYFPFADRVEDAIDALQDEVMERADRTILTRVFALKRELIAVRRAVSPVREVLNQLTNRELGLIDPPEVLYFRDIYDHVIRLTDELDTDRELVAATLDVYLSQVNNNLSAIMKRLTGATVILAGIGAIAGIFGMSEAALAFSGGEAVGFWAVAVATIAISLLAAFVLRRLDWI